MTAKQKGAGFEGFCRHAKQLPMRIMASGLGQALAFLNAKAKTDPNAKAKTEPAAAQLLQELGDWVLDKCANPARTKPKPTDEALLRQIVDKDSDFLRCATDETIAYLQWLNRFAEAEGPAVVEGPAEGG
jgi:CRISPR-associated protein Cmr5